ncbi:MAG: hypothetical protein LBJ74_01585 [Heliobacteriaceae bacterium]|nr:hypothetical protein [Heliobacteriaceae bacterium]
MRKEILALLTAAFLCANTAVADTVDVDNFNDLNTAVADGTSPKIINIRDDLTSSVDMKAQGAAELTINGGGFTLNGGYSGQLHSGYNGFNLKNGQTLTLNNINMTLFNSEYNAQGQYDHGGVIYNDGNGTVNISDNAIFTSNSAVRNGGAIYSSYYGTVTIRDNASFTSNTAGGNGGAIYNSGDITIGNNAAFTGNSADSNGGVIYNYSDITIGNHASFTGNSANGNGGAIYSIYGTVTLNTDSDTTTFSGNTDSTGPNDIYLYNAAKLNINDTGNVTFDGGISSSDANAAITQNSTGEVTFTDTANNNNFKGTYTQTAGTTTYYGGVLAGTNNINNSNLNLFQNAATLAINNLSLNNAGVNSINNVINTFNINSLSASGINNFYVDIDGAAGTSDTFNITTASGTGTINIVDFNLVDVPTAKSIPLTIFTGDTTDYTFTSSETELVTPIYVYYVKSEGKGKYRLFRSGGDDSSFNKDIFRGQASTLAVYQNQLIVNNTLFDHVYLDSHDRTAGMANRYAAGTEMFAPYQFSKKDGSIWTKTYTTFERLSMTQDINIASNSYGQLVGADFPVVELSKGWKFLPTAYISYNGGHQTFNGVSMYQNGGQGGFMGTFSKGDFLGSVLAYGGGYNNEMSVSGSSESAGNWFAGTAVKGAYNFRPSKNFIIQPNILASYNIFGKQNWSSNYGALSMNSGMLNGINVAPGLNLIYGRETWSIYLTALYMNNINDSVGGHAGSVNLPTVSMRHGYIEYGVGATKSWKDRLSSYVQFIVRNGGRTGVGFQLGLTWKF